MSDVLLFLAIIPVVLILRFIYKNDKKPEPSNLLTKLFVAGALGSVFLTFLLTDIWEIVLGETYTIWEESSSGLGVFAFYFLTVGLVEEFSKWIFVYLIGYRSKFNDERYDGIVYAVFVSLGFACLENILYVVFSDSGIATAITRAFLSVPGHAADAFFMGIFFGLARKAKEKDTTKGNEPLYLLLSLIVPTAIHGLYDTCLSMSNSIYLVIFYILVIITNVAMFIGAIRIGSRDERFGLKQAIRMEVAKRVGHCPRCGSVEVGTRHCVKCGTKLR